MLCASGDSLNCLLKNLRNDSALDFVGERCCRDRALDRFLFRADRLLRFFSNGIAADKAGIPRPPVYPEAQVNNHFPGFHEPSGGGLPN